MSARFAAKEKGEYFFERGKKRNRSCWTPIEFTKQLSTTVGLQVDLEHQKKTQSPNEQLALRWKKGAIEGGRRGKLGGLLFVALFSFRVGSCWARGEKEKKKTKEGC